MNVSTEMNQTCEEVRLFGEQVLNDNVELGLRGFTIAFIASLQVTGTCLTSFAIFIILKYLRQTTFLVILQLLILDLMVLLTVFPLMIVSAVNGRWIFGLPLCRICHALLVFAYHMRGWLLIVFISDRLCSVFAPLLYPKYREKIVWSIYGIALIITVLFIVFVLASDCSGLDRNYWLCFGQSHRQCSNRAYCAFYDVFEVIVSNFIGTFFPMIMFVVLFLKTKQLENRVFAMNATSEDGERRKRDRKVTWTFFAIFLFSIGVIIPPFILYILRNFVLRSLGVEPLQALGVLSYLGQNLFFSVPINNSIILLRNPEIRKAIKTFKIQSKNVWREAWIQAQANI